MFEKERKWNWHKWLSGSRGHIHVHTSGNKDNIMCIKRKRQESLCFPDKVHPYSVR